MFSDSGLSAACTKARSLVCWPAPAHLADGFGASMIFVFSVCLSKRLLTDKPGEILLYYVLTYGNI